MKNVDNIPTYKMPDENEPGGNIFFIMADVNKLLQDYGLNNEADEMNSRVFKSKSYEEAKSIIGEYVNVY